MIVTQSDYIRWQNLYGQSNNDVKDQTKAENQNIVDGRQNFALDSGKEESLRSTLANSIREKSFLEEMFERTLNNRLGIDQGKMDELKEEIEKTQTAIDAHNKTKPHNVKQQKELTSLEDKLKKLEEALNELVMQASERAIEKDKLEPKTNQLIAQYQSVASILF